MFRTFWIALLAVPLWFNSQIVNGHVIPTKNNDLLLNEMSMPQIYKLGSIPSTFTTDGSTTLNEGRIILTPKANSKGGLWLKAPFEMDGSFSLEWTFRSFDYRGFSSGGLSFWIIDSANLKKNDKTLYDGPSQFIGLQLLIDRSGPYGEALRAQLSDGSNQLTKASMDENTFGSCLIGYQDASVPSTLRVTYDINDNHLLKVQINNQICFQTRKVKLVGAGSKANFKIGVTADNGENNKESFEILKFNAFSKANEASKIPNIKSMPQPQIVTQMTNSKTGETKLIDKKKFDAEKNDEFSNYDLFQKLNKVEGNILVNDIRPLDQRLDSIIQTQEGLMKFMDHFLSTLSEEDDSSKDQITKDKSEFKDFLKINSNLESLLEEQERIRETTKKVGEFGLHDTHIDDVISNLKIILIPVAVILCVMIYYTFSTQQYIKKAKYL
ncbi:similar to Saccharomyces cerevisiae YFL048C EMP47 Integral membrane component of endoplasmic reticulum-derived COPII-coated vesicles, which function in ER to Golgi transport [Maudiozyma saulgeensis]|uniref:Similar to Saccharomyces cerevisiae YFL048C EMP47 Integral membrane component of endoplasmic reticulum-derived COPII-coated vesicles, which function in ER to Golgi transport n=1 Tax=Maudiozyma saulgeensis TaxID=1789683 RepID=A0A1X7R3C7_9SACH|nr:similar to Saccharomyces cerevisiae YFL048C EMP47 Integral membrane component of endoplasmic reticulum-derived COPII-coated vesicles, which function in ER to Golgi transport [Kazachstania saulgeensis]